MNIKDYRYTDYVLIVLAIAAAIWFFMGYPSQTTRNSIEISFTKKQIRSKAINKLAELGYNPGNFEVINVMLKKNERLLDSLQTKLGRHFIQWEQNHNQSNLKPYYWQVKFFPKGVSRSSEHLFGQPISKSLKIRFSEQGQFLTLTNPFKKFPENIVRRPALSSIFIPSPDSTPQTLFASVSDSTLSQLLVFNFHINKGPFLLFKRVPESMALRNFSHQFPFLLSVNDARALAQFYVTQTGWNNHSLSFDTVFVQRINDVRAANVRYVSTGSKTGDQLQLDVAVAPSGALMNIDATYFPGQSQTNSSSDIWSLVIIIIFVILALVCIIVFISRIQSGAVDTTSSLIFAITAGIFLLIIYFLRAIVLYHWFSGSGFFNGAFHIYQIIPGLITSIFTAIGFFMLFAISDSVTRQYWPGKLRIYDYLRKKQLFNKPVGLAIVRAVCFSFILCGVWMILLNIFPNASLTLAVGKSAVFFKSLAFLPALRLLLTNSIVIAWFVPGIFLVIGGLVIGKTNRRWIAALVIIILCGIAMPLYMSINPGSVRFLIGLLIGVVLTVIYFEWDFITLLLAQFLFLCWLTSSSGWVVANSPDLSIFIVFAAISFGLLIIGCIGIYRGESRPSLGEYEPDYVEELAQEHRIKQELQIARKVQQSFLPVKIPSVNNLDIAAACLPANETGGDYYDTIPLDDHRVAVAIGDVSGKGIEAAFYMTLVKGMLHTLCRETTSPVEILSKINRLFYDNSPKNTFISLIFGVIDTQTETFTLARAGHNPVLHFRKSTGNVDILQPDGLGLGLTKEKIFDNKINEIELSITEDDVFFLYTDGIVEALNQARQFYGTDNLIQLIKEQKNNTASELVHAVTRSVNRFIGSAKQHDDMTLMAIRFKDEKK